MILKALFNLKRMIKEGIIPDPGKVSTEEFESLIKGELKEMMKKTKSPEDLLGQIEKKYGQSSGGVKPSIVLKNKKVSNVSVHFQGFGFIEIKKN